MSNRRKVTDMGQFFRQQGADAERANTVRWLREVAKGVELEGKAMGEPKTEKERDMLMQTVGAHVALMQVASQMEATLSMNTKKGPGVASPTTPNPSN